MHQVPDLRSPRLILRGWTDADVAPFSDLCADPRVMEHFPGRLSTDEAAAFVDRVRQAWDQDGFGLWAVGLTDGAPTGPAPFVGYTGLARCDWLAPGAVEVGWRLAADHWGHGYAPEAATHALAVAFLELQLEEGDGERVGRGLGRVPVAPVVGGQPPADLDRARCEPVAAGQAGVPDERRRPGGSPVRQPDGPEPEAVLVPGLPDPVDERGRLVGREAARKVLHDPRVGAEVGERCDVGVGPPAEDEPWGPEVGDLVHVDSVPRAGNQKVDLFD